MEVVDYVDNYIKNAVVMQRPVDDALLLPAWSKGDWDKLFSHTVPRRYSAREVVVERGGTDRTLCFVMSGALEVGITRIDSVSILPLAHIAAGSIVGEQTFFDGWPHSATVWAVSGGELLCMSFEEFGKFSAAEPALARDFLFAAARVLSIRLRNTSVRIRR